MYSTGEYEKMNGIFRVLYEIRKKPALYFGGRKSLSLIRAFINGYLEKQREIDPDCHDTFALNGFQEFVQNKYGLGTMCVQSWDRIIDFYNSSDDMAFDTFYELLDEFLSNNI